MTMIVLRSTLFTSESRVYLKQYTTWWETGNGPYPVFSLRVPERWRLEPR
jgi:hypothetical protein